MISVQPILMRKIYKETLLSFTFTVSGSFLLLSLRLHDQGHLQKEVLIWVCSSGRIRVHPHLRGMAAMATCTGSCTAIRELPSWVGSRECTMNSVLLLNPQTFLQWQLPPKPTQIVPAPGSQTESVAGSLIATLHTHKITE